MNKPLRLPGATLLAGCAAGPPFVVPAARVC